MMKQKCPKCQTVIEVDEKEYPSGSSIERQCPLCSTLVRFNIPVEQIYDQKHFHRTSAETKELIILQAENDALKERLDQLVNQQETIGKQDNKENSPKEKQKTTIWIWIILLSIAVISISIWSIFSKNEGHIVAKDAEPREAETIKSRKAEVVDARKAEEVSSAVIDELFPSDEKVNELINRYVKALSNDEFDAFYTIYAPIVERYHNANNESRQSIVDRHRRYNNKFGVYAKHCSVRWNTIQISRLNHSRILVTFIEDFSIDRYDKSAYSVFVLEKHFILNDQYQIVSEYDDQLSRQ